MELHKRMEIMHTYMYMVCMYVYVFVCEYVCVYDDYTLFRCSHFHAEMQFRVTT